MSVGRDPMETVGAWLTEGAPDDAIPEGSMPPIPAMRLVDQELAVEGIPERNLATFVTTWMEPEAREVILTNLHRNFIDHAEYPQTFEIQQRCVRMLAELFHAPGETTGTSTQGSSEAIMLGALSLKWKWRQRREAAGKPTDSPNLVFGGDVHVVWEKFCRYFDVEPRIVPLQPGKYTIGPEDVVGPDAQGIPPGAFDALLEAMLAKSAYANVHTAAHEGGEIRGQIALRPEKVVAD